MTRPGVHTVAAGHAVTADAAVAVLDAGGNAFDAVVAAGFAACIAEPMLTSMAGGGFCLTRTADGEAEVVDFFVDVPRGPMSPGPDGGIDHGMVEREVSFTATTQVFHVGWASVATPGCLRGWLDIHHRLGRAPLATVLAPAIAAARAGVRTNARQAYLFEILAPVNTLTDAVAARYCPDGVPARAGDLIAHHDTARFLARLAEDPNAAVAEFDDALLAASAAEGGRLLRDDLAGYRVARRAPHVAPYRDATLLTNAPPAQGGVLMAAQLAHLASGPPLAGIDAVDVPVRILEAQRHADGLRSPAATQGTTHVSVADADGNVATMTTSNGTGSGCAIPGIGVLANNMLGEDDLFPGGLGTGVPGTRIASMMAPTIVLDDRGTVRLALGSGGSKRIRTAIAQVVAHAVDRPGEVWAGDVGASALAAAVEAPRLHWDGTVAQVEPGFSDEAVRQLASTVPVEVWDAHDLYFGGVHAVRPGLDAAGDPRRGGVARIVPSPRP